VAQSSSRPAPVLGFNGEGEIAGESGSALSWTVRTTIESAVREALGESSLAVTRWHDAGGGCISHAARVETTHGDVFVKWNDRCPADLFLREADGLREMAAAACGLAVPRALGAWAARADRPAMIVMEYLRPGRSAGSEEALGRGLAALHRRTAPAFGFADTTYCGSTPQDNTWTPEWPVFFRDRRLEALLQIVEAERGLDAAARRTYDRLLARIPDLLSGTPVPSLIHGDLWSGNVVQTAQGPGLVDPACAYADREMELGITTLFGGFGEGFWRAYDEAWRLPDGWRERNPLYQLYHLLNHHALFGGHYGEQALAIARRYA
jgi:protein-ribulosamine 3-kinase